MCSSEGMNLMLGSAVTLFWATHSATDSSLALPLRTSSGCARMTNKVSRCRRAVARISSNQANISSKSVLACGWLVSKMTFVNTGTTCKNCLVRAMKAGSSSLISGQNLTPAIWKLPLKRFSRYAFNWLFSPSFSSKSVGSSSG